jgi:non-ribosomal peptide synthetase component F
LDEQLSFWKRHLHGAEAAFTLPTDYPRPRLGRRRGARHRFEVGQKLSDVAQAIARRHEASLPMVLLAAFALAIGKHTGQPDVVIGSAVSRRTEPGTEQMVGQFMNTLPLRIRSADRPTLRLLVPHVKCVLLEALEHQDAPFHLVVEQAAVEYGSVAEGLGQLTFVMADATSGSVALGGLSATLQEPEHLTSRRDLTLSIAIAEGSIVGTITYDADLFHPSTIERMGKDFHAAIASASSDCDDIRDVGVPRASSGFVDTERGST